MEEEFYGAAYKGSKHIKEPQVRSSKAGSFGIAGNDSHGVDLNDQFIRNKPATFFIRMNGESMIGAGIHHGDTLIVDRSLAAQTGKVIVAQLNGEMLVRRLEKTFNRIRLVPETKDLSSIDIDTSACEFAVWGVVTYVIHAV